MAAAAVDVNDEEELKKEQELEEAPDETRTTTTGATRNEEAETEESETEAETAVTRKSDSRQPVVSSQLQDQSPERGQVGHSPEPPGQVYRSPNSGKVTLAQKRSPRRVSDPVLKHSPELSPKNPGRNHLPEQTPHDTAPEDSPDDQTEPGDHRNHYSSESDKVTSAHQKHSPDTLQKHSPESGRRGERGQKLYPTTPDTRDEQSDIDRQQNYPPDQGQGGRRIPRHSPSVEAAADDGESVEPSLLYATVLRSVDTEPKKATGANNGRRVRFVPPPPTTTAATNVSRTAEQGTGQQSAADDYSCTVTLYPRYLVRSAGVLRIVQVLCGIIVCGSSDAEQCSSYGGPGGPVVVCAGPTSRAWFHRYQGQGFVMFVGSTLIVANVIWIAYHVYIKRTLCWRTITVAASVEPSLSLSSSSSGGGGARRTAVRRGGDGDGETGKIVELTYDCIAFVLYIVAGSVQAWYASDPDTIFRAQWIVATVSTDLGYLNMKSAATVLRNGSRGKMLDDDGRAHPRLLTICYGEQFIQS